MTIYRMLFLAMFLLCSHLCEANPAAPTSRESYAFFSGCMSGNTSIVKSFIAKYGDELSVTAVNKYGETALHIAVIGGQTGIARILLDSGANVNAKDHNGWTPLFFSGKRPNKDLVELLIQHGAQVNISSNSGWTPVHALAVSDNSELIRLLAKNGGKVNVGDNDGNTPIYEAIELGNLKTVKELIHLGARVNVSNAIGMTPLHIAALNGCYDIAACLVKCGANTTAQTKKQLRLRNGKIVPAGKTPLAIAQITGHSGVARLLSHQPNKPSRFRKK